MANLIKIRDGKALTVYDDRWRTILEAIAGRPLTGADCPRASEVEMDDRGNWVATDLATGRVIARARNRAAVIAAEVAWLEARL